MQVKGLRKLCGKLREDRLLAVHSRLETREGMQRPITKDYYYIDFHLTIDAIKYRIYRITKEVEQMFQPTEEKKDYFCPRCKSRWTQLEVLDNPGPLGFNCHKCDGPLERDDDSAAERGGHEKQSRLMSQLHGMLNLLQQIDRTVIPNNDFDAAFSVAVPIQRNQIVNPVRAMAPATADGRPTSVKGLAQTSGAQIEVSVTTSSERSAAEQATEAQRRAALAEQNALPVWHTNSTVSGEATALGSKEAAARREREYNGVGTDTSTPLKGEDMDEKKTDDKQSAELDAYFAELEAERQKQAREDQEEDSDEEEDEDEDEEDEFEDVPAASGQPQPQPPTAAPAAAAVPATSSSSSAGINGAQQHASLAQNGQQPGTGSSSSAGNNTPAGGAGNGTGPGSTAPATSQEAADGPAAKKPRIDGDSANSFTSTQTADGQAGDQPAPPAPVKQEEDSDEDDDDVEFEDV
ncbi:hypothetical protein L228DRAFT_156104 [Xylona heveae TC161]|uniref:HTH TFE/IIEalpha-type domain-containing protein n=1 Tax=Xylona heveae (strain CBS 132557 / TC161) TaxID=1328760 RepID=A0A165G024_XYLHT|nr:hypothetical protein L228DRAFT_156104 [Xylona heveae TC161]KZF21583.1 hypothetical protein L228DRAFT_156104 [Xylona heveae TC161]